PPRGGPACVCSGDRVVTGGNTCAAVRPVPGGAPTIHSRPWVVPSAVSIRRVERVVHRGEPAIPDVGWVVPAGTPDRTAPGDHQARVPGHCCEGHPLVCRVLLDDGDVRHVVGRRGGGNLIDLFRNRCRHFPGAGRAPPHEPDTLEAHVIEIADLDDVLVSVHR